MTQLNPELHGWATAPHSSMSGTERKKERWREIEKKNEKREDPKAQRQGIGDQRAAL